MADITWYEPRRHELTDDVPGFDAALLADLHDCILNFGAPTGSDEVMRRISFDGIGTQPIYATAKTRPYGEVTIVIGRTPYGVESKGVRTIVLSAPKPSGVVIERGITAEEVRGLIDTVDAPLREGGMFDAEGRRRRIMFDDPESNLMVGRVFQKPGSVLRVPDDRSHSDILALFDSPQELFVAVYIGTTKGSSYAALFHMNDPKMRPRAEATLAIAAEWGFGHPNEITRFDTDAQARFFAEVHKKLAESGN